MAWHHFISICVIFCLVLFQFIVQIMASKGAGKNKTLREIYVQLEENDQDFLQYVSSADPLCYDLLNISDAPVPMKLVKILTNFYDVTEEVFICNGHRLFITLEDVLYITGLPISGHLIAKAQKNKSNFHDILNLPVIKSKCSLKLIKNVVLERNTSNDIRLKAL